ncbi:MAG: hypothetical protein ACR2PO_01510 [Methyloligellaceae bacterium]
MKLPPHQFDATLAFYRDTLGLTVVESEDGCALIDYGAIRLWLDRTATVSQAEIWLELKTNETDAAAAHLDKAGVVRCDAIETLPNGFRGFWIASPANIVHLVAEPGQDGSSGETET